MSEDKKHTTRSEVLRMPEVAAIVEDPESPATAGGIVLALDNAEKIAEEMSRGTAEFLGVDPMLDDQLRPVSEGAAAALEEMKGMIVLSGEVSGVGMFTKEGGEQKEKTEPTQAVLEFSRRLYDIVKSVLQKYNIGDIGSFSQLTQREDWDIIRTECAAGAEVASEELDLLKEKMPLTVREAQDVVAFLLHSSDQETPSLQKSIAVDLCLTEVMSRGRDIGVIDEQLQYIDQLRSLGLPEERCKDLFENDLYIDTQLVPFETLQQKIGAVADKYLRIYPADVQIIHGYDHVNMQAVSPEVFGQVISSPQYSAKYKKSILRSSYSDSMRKHIEHVAVADILHLLDDPNQIIRSLRCKSASDLFPFRDRIVEKIGQALKDAGIPHTPLVWVLHESPIYVLVDADTQDQLTQSERDDLRTLRKDSFRNYEMLKNGLEAQDVDAVREAVKMLASDSKTLVHELCDNEWAIQYPDLFIDIPLWEFPDNFNRRILLEVAKKGYFSEKILQTIKRLFSLDELVEIFADKLDGDLLSVPLLDIREYVPHDRLVEMAKLRPIDQVFAIRHLFSKSELAHLFAQANQRDVFLYLKDNADAQSYLPWGETYKQLYQIQQPANRIEHDPISNEFGPLLRTLTSRGVVSVEKSTDGECLVEYAREFGVTNMPTIAEIVIRSKRGDLLEAIEQFEELKKKITELLGEKYFTKKRNSSEIVNDIRRVKSRIQNDILTDVPNETIETDLGVEILNAVRRTSKWDRHSDLKRIVETTFASQRGQSELLAVPKEYREETVMIATVSKRELGSDEIKIRAKRQSEIVARTEDSVRAVHEVMSVILTREPIVITQEGKQRILSALQQGSEDMHAKMVSAPNEKARMHMEKSIVNMDELATVIREKLSSVSSVAEVDVAQTIDMLAGVPKLGGAVDKAITETLRLLSARHMYDCAPEGMRSLIETFVAQPDPTLKIQQGSSLLRQYVHEHYMQGKQDVDHTNHTPLHKETTKRLRLLWQLKEQEIEENLIIRAEKELAVLDQAGQGVGEQKALTFVPGKGLLRVIAGDVGDACYASRAQELAEGKYPGITAVAMVSNRGKSNESLDGSFLLVETKTPEGKPVMVVRANNPRMNLFEKYNTDALIVAVLDYAKQTAARRGIDIVGVPRDGAAQSSSNRGEVSSYYGEVFAESKPIVLVDEPETNFNGYKIHNPHSGHPIVQIT